MTRINGFLGRRQLLQLAGGSILMSFSGVAQATAAENEVISPDAALERLLDGNKRFIQQKSQHPHQSKIRLEEVAQAQHPFATILSCADSRVSGEILFDQGMGDLFDIRIAGNIVTPEALGSIEYAAVELSCPLIMVLGHERCGAVTAAVKGEPLPGLMGTFVKGIKPAIKDIKGFSKEAVEKAVVENVKYQVQKMRGNSQLLSELVDASKLKIVGGRYDLDTGEVTII
ncbi:carbonic anhydrase [Calothrix sp. NIES-4071]|nr:carbonic anhydrase [Calothrix sp. NIES-4071]BAZ61526.1 carbonic anhydrase [Calothrix sp. NIES-4105]